MGSLKTISKTRKMGATKFDGVDRLLAAIVDRAEGFVVTTLGWATVYTGVAPLPSSSRRTNWSILFISLTKFDEGRLTRDWRKPESMGKPSLKALIATSSLRPSILLYVS